MSSRAGQGESVRLLVLISLLSAYRPPARGLSEARRGGEAPGKPESLVQEPARRGQHLLVEGPWVAGGAA